MLAAHSLAKEAALGLSRLQNICERFALHCLPKLSHSRTNEEKEALRLAFASHDRNKDGMVDMYELGTVMHAVGQTPSLPELQEIFSEYDTDGDKLITFDEFWKMSQEKYIDPREVRENIRKIFDRIDSNQNGEIEKVELKEVFLNLDENPSSEELQAMIELADLNQNGRINFEEFCYILEVPHESQKRAKRAKNLASGRDKWANLRSLIKYSTHWKPIKSYAQRLEEAKEKGQDLKTVTFIRHGQSAANIKSDENPDEDPFEFDALLTPHGEDQARAAAEVLKDKNFDLIVVSPLRRACLTARLALDKFLDHLTPVVLADAAEDVTASDDMGSEFSERNDPRWAAFDWSHMPPEEIWWYIPDKLKPKEGEPPLTVAKNREQFRAEQWVEPWGHTLKRAEAFQEWLVNRKEQRICVVSHRGFIEGMTGQELRNAEAWDMEYIVSDFVATKP